MNHTVYNNKNVQCKSLKRNRLLAFLLLFFLLGVVQPVFADEEEWPKEYQMQEARIVVYQPQLESFDENKLTARTAVSVTKTSAEPVFGTMWLAARVATDRRERVVTLMDIDITNVKFSTVPDPAKIDAFSKILNDQIAKSKITISLDRLLTMMELVETKEKESRNLKFDPPRIIVVNHPAVLVSINGDPELRKIEGTSLMRVINTPFFIVLDPASKKYYLKGGNNWFATSDVKGPWENTPKPPASVLNVSRKEFEGLEEVDAGKKVDDDRMPEIIVSSTPTELITTEGEPSYKTISNTNLLYVSNTESDLFMEINSQKYFVLISGRWYSSKSLNGPWFFVLADKLPADFAKIPESSDKAGVLANVAGTTQAKEAVLDTYIPQTVAVDRNKKVEAEVKYDGDPKFEKIKKTSMQYAVNTPASVIKVGGFYYLCQDAVWYISDLPTGPWAVAVKVPEEVYTIPPSSPAYNVTYVHVYDHTPTVVYVGYYPGYYGSYVYSGTVVYGTGYIYPAWYGTVYYPPPVTWGVSVRYCPYYGRWGVRVGYGAPIGWLGRTARRSYWRNKRYDAFDDRRDFRRDRYNDKRNQQDQRYQDKKDRDTARRDGMQDRQDKRGDGGKRDKVDNRRDEQQSRPDNRGEARRDKRDSRGKDRTATSRANKNNVYSDRQGNVHRKTGQGWQQRGSGGWSKPESGSRSSSARSGSNRSDLNRQFQARERGSNRSSNFQQNRSSGRSSYGGSRGRGRSGGSRGGRR